MSSPSLSGNKAGRDTRKQTVTIIGIALALFGVLITQLWEVVTGITVGNTGVALFKWALVGGVILLTLVFEQESLSSIGITFPNRYDIVTGVGIFVLGLVSVGVATPLVDAIGLDTAPFGGSENGGVNQTVTALLVSLFIGVTAGITEEVLYRGYGLERLETIVGSTWIAATATAALFVVIHFDYSFGGLLIITPLAVFLTLAYVWRRNIFVPIIGHVLINSFWEFTRLVALIFESI